MFSALIHHALAEVAAFVVNLLGVPAPYTLALDRTNWQVGIVDLNILMLSIVYRGIGFPVVWVVLPKAGNSDTTERETVLEIFIALFGAPNIACVLGDREFVGKQWFRFLKQHRIKFQMRLKKDTLAHNARGQWVQAWRLFCRTRINCTLVIPQARQMWGMDLFLSGRRLEHGEYLKPAICASFWPMSTRLKGSGKRRSGGGSSGFNG